MSSSDLLTKFDNLVKRFTQEFQLIVEGERAKLKAELDEYNAEKQRMKAIDVSGNDIISLNVSGQKFTATRSTLCQVEGSLLSSMFSGRWEEGLKREQDGAVFFDFNPEYFGYIMDYLRRKKIATPEEPAELPKVQPDDLKKFTSLVDYLGLSNEISLSRDAIKEIVKSERFSKHESESYLLDQGRVAGHTTPFSGVAHALGKNRYKQGHVHLMLKLESFDNNNGLFVGIARADAVQLDNPHSYNWPGSYGWILGRHGFVWENASLTCDESLKNLAKQGDMVDLFLNCNEGKLSLRFHTNARQFHIDIPKSKTWRLNVNVMGVHDRLRIFN